jgi:hypothetical protein
VRHARCAARTRCSTAGVCSPLPRAAAAAICRTLRARCRAERRRAARGWRSGRLQAARPAAVSGGQQGARFCACGTDAGAQQHTVVLRSPNERRRADVQLDCKRRRMDWAQRPMRVCAVCAGTGLKPCGQCSGTGRNTEDLFGGRFVKGDVCWLCEVRRARASTARFEHSFCASSRCADDARTTRLLIRLCHLQGAASTMCGACADMTDSF